jgi:hypothetical protein
LLTVNGATTIDGANLSALGGATLSLPAVSSYAVPQLFKVQSFFRAEGTGSVLVMPNLTSITGSTQAFSYLNVEALAGGRVDLASLGTITGPAGGSGNLHGVRLLADGFDSTIDLTYLTSFTNNAPAPGSSLEARNGGTILDPRLTELDGVDLPIDGTGTLSTTQITTLRRGDVTISGGSAPDLSNISSIDGSRFFISDGITLSLNASSIDGASFFVGSGATLSLPAASSYMVPQLFNVQSFFQAEGTGSVLAIPNLTDIRGSTQAFSYLNVEALAGGKVDLASLGTIIGPGGGSGNLHGVRLLADGSDSTIDLTSLTSFTNDAPTPDSRLEVRNGGTVELVTTGTTTFGGVHVTFDEPGVLLADTLELLDRAVLSGSGTLTADVINDGGTVDSNASAGSLTVNGNYTQTASGSMIVTIGGPIAGSGFDQVIVTGVADLLGTFATSLSGGYAPALGDEFEVVTFASRHGGFTDYVGLDAGANIEFVPLLSDANLTLVTSFATGASILDATFSDGNAQGTAPFIDVTFSEPINLASFRNDDVVVTGPTGDVNVLNPVRVGTSNTVFRIELAVSAVEPGDYSVAIGANVLDLAGNLMNQDGDTFNGEPVDDVFSTTFYLALPDLLAVSVNVQATPATFGGPASITWTVQNVGQASADSDWLDDVWLSSDQTWDADDFSVAAFEIGDETPLGVGASYTRSATILLPESVALNDGVYYLLLRSDVDDDLLESNDANNTVASNSFEITVPSLPDLVVTDVTVAGVEGQPGQSIEISWTVLNRGSQTADGPWTDAIYLSPTGDLQDATRVGELTRELSVGIDRSYSASATVLLPALEDGAYQVLVVTDDTNTLFEHIGEINNSGAAGVALDLKHADLTITIISAPDDVSSGDPIDVTWSTTNQGTTATLAGWSDRLLLSVDADVSSDDILLGSFIHDGPLAVGGDATANATVTIPAHVSGNWFLIVVADADDEIIEARAEDNNQASRVLSVQLSPWADLVVTDVSAPIELIDDPATLTVNWTVRNDGIAAGKTHAWHDAVILSTNATLGDNDDLLVGRFAHIGQLDVGADYDGAGTVLLPPALTGRFHVFVVADYDGVVFENDQTSNNSVEADDTLDVMPILYADLVVTDIHAGAPIQSGQPIDVTWTVTNQGRGLTDLAEWHDVVSLATDPTGQDRVVEFEPFNHFGQLSPGERYERTGRVVVPDGMTGTFYIVVETGGPFEFIFDTNNTTVSDAVEIVLAPPPDLTVTDVNVPGSADEGRLIDVTWTVKNIGVGDAEGTWEDLVYLQEAGNLSAPRIELGKFAYVGPLAVGQSYTRREAIILPSQISDAFNLVVVTNHDQTLYEHGATANNARTATAVVLVQVTPRPDLRVPSITVPDQVDAGGTLTVEFTVRNHGIVPATGTWLDFVYLSLDDKVSADDIRVSELGNGSALLPGEAYVSFSDSVVIPKRFRGEIQVLVFTDAEDQVNEWPNDQNNVSAEPVFVNPLPLADLVIGGNDGDADDDGQFDVIAPDLSNEAARIEVRYTVTNLGSGPTDVTSWNDTIWLTRDRNRPHPGHGDFLLATIERNLTEPLVRDAGYDVVATV